MADTITWVATTEGKYWEMLGVLPPASRAGCAFQVGEPMDHRDGRPTFASFKEEPEGCFWESADPLTFRQFRGEFPKAEYYYNS